MMVRAGVALLIVGLQALEAFLFIRGLNLPARWSWCVIVVFGIFTLPLPYIFWLQAGARQPAVPSGRPLVPEVSGAAPPRARG